MHCLKNSTITSLIFMVYSAIVSSSSLVAAPIAMIWLSLIMGSPRASSLRQYSRVGHLKAVPSGTPKRFEKEPAALFLTITSRGTIVTFLRTVSRSLSSSTKSVGTPFSSSSLNIKFDMRLFTTPLPTIVPFFSPLNAVASSL